MDRISAVDPLCPPGQAAAGQVGQLRRDVEAVRLNPVAPVPRPLLQSLHQVAAGAADVQEGAVPVDGVGDQAAGALPGGAVVAAAARLAPGSIFGEIRRRDDRRDLSVPAHFIDLCRLQCCFQPGKQRVGPVLRLFDRPLCHCCSSATPCSSWTAASLANSNRS